MTAREQMIAYLATLGALVAVIFMALVIAALVPEVMGKMEVFGLGTVTGDLIGILRLPTNRNVTIGNPASDPVPVEPAAEPKP